MITFFQLKLYMHPPGPLMKQCCMHPPGPLMKQCGMYPPGPLMKQCGGMKYSMELCYRLYSEHNIANDLCKCVCSKCKPLFIKCNIL